MRVSTNAKMEIAMRHIGLVGLSPLDSADALSFASRLRLVEVGVVRDLSKWAIITESRKRRGERPMQLADRRMRSAERATSRSAVTVWD